MKFRVLSSLFLIWFLTIDFNRGSKGKKKVKKSRISDSESSSHKDSDSSVVKSQDEESSEDLLWVGKKTSFSTYIGKFVPDQEDDLTENSESFESSSSQEDQKFKIRLYPLIRNTGNSCAFDSLLQVLLMLKFFAFRRIRNDEKAYERCLERLKRAFPMAANQKYIPILLDEIWETAAEFYETRRAVMRLSKTLIKSHMEIFSAGYSNEIPRMADPAELFNFFFAMLGRGQEFYEWSIHQYINGRFQKVSQKMLLVPVNGVKDLGMLLAYTIESEEVVEDSLVVKRTIIKQSPQYQIFYLNRTYRKEFRSKHRSNFLSQRNIKIPIILGSIYQSKFKAAICVNTKSVPHYFVITRELNAADNKYYLVLYDGLAKHPKIFTNEQKGIALIERMSIILFYQKIKRADEFVYENNYK
jgi:hypothetical protein